MTSALWKPQKFNKGGNLSPATDITIMSTWLVASASISTIVPFAQSQIMKKVTCPNKLCNLSATHLVYFKIGHPIQGLNLFYYFILFLVINDWCFLPITSPLAT